MSQFWVRGGTPLYGELQVQGAKNSVLPLLAATLLCEGKCVLSNCPKLRDVEIATQILSHLGAEVYWSGETLTVDASSLTAWDIPAHLMREMRSSVVFLGAILARTGRAELSQPGGCRLGARPIDFHLQALQQMGAILEETEGSILCRPSLLHGETIRLPFPSVGATENLMLAACGAKGETLIENAAREPEIVDLQNFLQTCGADVTGAGGSIIRIRGGRPLHGATYAVMGDRIVAATYLCATAVCGGEIVLEGVHSEQVSAVSHALTAAGCQIWSEHSRIAIRKRGRLRAIPPVRTAPYPAFPTDAQALLMAPLSMAVGTSRIEETIFESRFRHVAQLKRLGANIRVDGSWAEIQGVPRLHGATLTATDLRGGAALCLAALGAEGESLVKQGFHIERGYADLAQDLCHLGAVVQRQEEHQGGENDAKEKKISQTTQTGSLCYCL